jgi:hypothetical protein
VLLNPALVMAPIAGQLPFLWAVSLLFLGIGSWRRGHMWRAVALVALAQMNHPAVILPVTAAVVALAWVWAPDRRRLLLAYGASLVPALPAAYLVFVSPVFEDSSLRDKLANFFGTVGMRGLVVAVPLALVVLQRTHLRRALLPVGVCAVLAALNFVVLEPLHVDTAWRSLRRQPEVTIEQWLAGPTFQPGLTYRYLRPDDDKVGMYRLLKAGARLDSEFFPESQVRRSWPDTQAYSRFLRRRGVDRVLFFDTYQTRFGTNERALLDDMAASPGCRPGEVGVHVTEHLSGFTVYAIDRTCFVN